MVAPGVVLPTASAASAAPSPSAERRAGLCFLAAPAATIATVVALAVKDVPRPVDVVRAIVTICWAAGGTAVGIRRRTERLGPIVLGGAVLGAAAMVADALDQATIARVLLGVLPAAGLHLLMSLPDGSIGGRPRQIATFVGYGIGALSGLLAPQRASGPALWPFVVLWLIAVVAGLSTSNGRYRSTDATSRRRMQWVGWALAVLAAAILVIIALRLLAEWPAHPGTAIIGFSALIPAALVAGTHGRMIARFDRLLINTVAFTGLTALVIAAYVAVVVMHGRDLDDEQRNLLLLSMAASLIAGTAFLPLRAKLTDAANQLVYGENVAPDDALRTWGGRLTRAIPLDELLLQLCESLRKSMSLAAAEIYTGVDGHYDLAAGVPHRSAPPVALGEKERQVVARAGVSGGTWLDVWMPELAPTNSANTRVAPIVHSGVLLGMIVLTRAIGAGPATDEDDRVVTELARQVGLALHNVQLDSALQASLEALQQTNLELEQSRLRIVSAGDAERRRLERNLHDGAQQHLVAMAVKLRMVEELVEDEPAEATKVIGELRAALKDAIAELRALAHGIFPPLLSSGGLREALPAAAGRSPLYTTVDAEGVARYSPEIESAVYFCCLEAMQNAGKHAGAEAGIAITVRESDGRLSFEVTDDGAGFAVGSVNQTGHGFTNMNDRIGAVGGRLSVHSAVGQGTTIQGEIPLP